MDILVTIHAQKKGERAIHIYTLRNVMRRNLCYVKACHNGTHIATFPYELYGSVSRMQAVVDGIGFLMNLFHREGKRVIYRYDHDARRRIVG